MSSREICPDLQFKHPLEHTWSLWYYENVKGKSWEENQREVYSFGTVEDFWCLFNHVKPASKLQVGSDYSIFKAGIRPMWEDKMNARGGRWIIKLEAAVRNNVDLDELWLDLVIYMIGEQFNEQTDNICGIILNVRSKCDKISIWTPNVRKKDEILCVGHKLKECLNKKIDVKLHYESHETAERKTSKNRYLYSI